MRVELLAPILFLLFVSESSSLNTDGVLLMQFKNSVLTDPMSVLQSWSYEHETPCSWRGVSCNNDSQVTNLSLPNSKLSGSVPSDLGLIKNLQSLDLSNNSLDGSLPVSIFYAGQLRVLDLSGNLISGELPASVDGLRSIQMLNLSDNALTGSLPANLGFINNLTVVSLKNNQFSGDLPGGAWRNVEFLDISSNLINGSVPADFNGGQIRYLNISHNRLVGEIPPEFGDNIPENATVDISFNKLTGQIPSSAKSPVLNASSATSPPAIAAIPKTIDSNPATYPNETTRTGSNPRPGLKPGVIVGIIVGDLAGIGILAAVCFSIYNYRKNKTVGSTVKSVPETASLNESQRIPTWFCLRNALETAPSDEEDEEEEEKSQQNRRLGEEDDRGRIVTVNGEKDLEVGNLLKASAYILGASGSSITYKAVLEDGSVLAVRRIAAAAVNRRFREFENHVRTVGRLVHVNLVRVRGFYWGADEKLLIYDFVPNGSLANARYRKGGSSPCHLPWDARFKIARGTARGLSYLHEKKHVHGNLKPNNILLNFDLEPKIGGFGLERLLTGETSGRPHGSSRIFGSKRSNADNLFSGPSPGPSPSLIGPASPYSAPESLRSLKPSPKWDVYSFGIILLELLTGKIVRVDESYGVENGPMGLRMADVAIRGEMEGKEDFLLACLKLGYSCASLVPHKRPNMKEVLEVLDKCPVSAKASFFHFGGSLSPA